MTHSETHIKTRAARKKEDLEAGIEAIDAILERKIDTFRQYAPKGASIDSPQYKASDAPLDVIARCKARITALNGVIQQHTPGRLTQLWEDFCNLFFKMINNEEMPEKSARRKKITAMNEGIAQSKALQAAQSIILVIEDREKEVQKLDQVKMESAGVPNKIEALKTKLQPLIKKTLYRELKTKATSAIGTFGKFSKPDNKLFKISLTLAAQSLMHFLENPTEDNHKRFLKTEQQNHVDWQKAKNASVFMPLLIEANTVYDLEKALPEQQETLSESPNKSAK